MFLSFHVASSGSVLPVPRSSWLSSSLAGKAWYMVATDPDPELCSWAISSGADTAWVAASAVKSKGSEQFGSVGASDAATVLQVGRSPGSLYSSCCRLGPPSLLPMSSHCLQSSQACRLRPSAFPCLCPALCSRWYRNSARISSHLATWCDGSFRLHSHIKEA